MSDILIRGTYFSFPRNGYRVFRIYADGRVEGETGVSLGAAVELQEHGRLIDADKLLHPDPSTESTPFAFTACKIIEAPTVIPSNKEDKNAN